MYKILCFLSVFFLCLGSNCFGKTTEKTVKGGFFQHDWKRYEKEREEQKQRRDREKKEAEDRYREEDERRGGNHREFKQGSSRVSSKDSGIYRNSLGYMIFDAKLYKGDISKKEIFTCSVCKKRLRLTRMLRHHVDTHHRFFFRRIPGTSDISKK